MTRSAPGMTRAQADRVVRILTTPRFTDIFILHEGRGLYSVHAVDKQTGYPFGVYTYPLIRVELPQDARHS